MSKPTPTNDWCDALGITPPTVEAVAHHREANTFALLNVALVERGEPMTLAFEAPLEVVVGSAPGWGEPWSRVSLARVVQDPPGWWARLVDEHGAPIDEGEVQRARLPARRP